jgi:regulator of cell morphogenesis and NO signaling
MSEETVGQIAAAAPGAVRVFEKYKIDYCCGGNRPLRDVCEERGLSAEAIAAELQAATTQGREPARDWRTASLSELIAHIVNKHHEYLRRELPAEGNRLERVIQAHGAKYPESLLPLKEVFAGLAMELEMHLRKEEMVLFPAIEELEAAAAAGRRPLPLPFGTVQNPIRMMISEHDGAGRALEEMRRLTGDYTLPADACNTYRALFEGLKEIEGDLHTHIHLENNILFPRAAELEAHAA